MFLSTPGMPWLYSGVTKRTASACAKAALTASTAAGLLAPSRYSFIERDVADVD